MSSDTVARTKEEKLQMLVGPCEGVEPYHSFFQSIGEASLSDDRRVRWAARREWLAFMRIHVTDYLSRWPDARDDLAEFMEHLLNGRRKLSAATRADAEALLAAAKNA